VARPPCFARRSQHCGHEPASDPRPALALATVPVGDADARVCNWDGNYAKIAALWLHKCCHRCDTKSINCT
jgi:hypothetical protein